MIFIPQFILVWYFLYIKRFIRRTLLVHKPEEEPVHLGVFYGFRNEENYYEDCLWCGFLHFSGPAFGWLVNTCLNKFYLVFVYPEII